MNNSSYLSIFSGIGGFEHPTLSPLLFCEQDEACQKVIRLAHPGVPIVSDIRLLHNLPPAGLVIGGWPCQDISSAGSQRGLRGDRSGLFFEMLRAARAADAHTLIGENVPNLLTINKGEDFHLLLKALASEDYGYVGWRVLNARQFGLPQERRRLFVVASRYPECAASLHARTPTLPSSQDSDDVFAFYWTAGKRSLCFSRGYSPALKIGAADNNGRATIAVFIGKRLRKLSARECLRLQGFDELEERHADLSRATLLRMAGNAVPRPMGHFVVESVFERRPLDGLRTAFGIINESGLYEHGLIWTIQHSATPVASNLADFLDPAESSFLSSQAAAGLLVRCVRSGQSMPLELFDLLSALSARRDAALRPSRANSFEVLDTMDEAVTSYRASLVTMADYIAQRSEDE